jgi:ribosomal protein L16/L10AE
MIIFTSLYNIMKQYPSQLKFKKYHKSSKSILSLSEQKVFFPAFGNSAIKLLAYSRLKFNQLEACRKSVRRKFRKTALIRLRPFTYQSITKKSLGSRMGSGKGQHSV